MKVVEGKFGATKEEGPTKPIKERIQMVLEETGAGDIVDGKFILTIDTDAGVAFMTNEENLYSVLGMLETSKASVIGAIFGEAESDSV